MSTLSSIDGKLAREKPRLLKFTLALIALGAQVGGYATKLGLQQKDFEKGRKTLFDVVVPLREALDQECPQIDFWPLVRRMKKGKKSMEDWRKDLDMVATQLQLKEPVTDEGLSILDEVHRVLEAEFSQDLRRLRNR